MRIALALVLFLASSPHAFCGAGAVRAFARGGAVLWAVGDAGLLLRSDDEGKNWRRVEWAGQADLTGACFTDEKTGYLFGGRMVAGHPGGATVAVIARTSDGGRSFERLSPGPMPALRGGWMRGLRGVVFGQLTPRHPAGLWITVTGGKLWVPVRASAGELLGGDWLDANNACFVGPAHRILFLHRLAELKTPGVPVSAGSALMAVRYVKAGIDPGRAPWLCWAAGEDGSVLHYAGPAAGWRVVTPPLPPRGRRLADFEAIAIDGRGAVYLAGGLSGTILRTADGGKTFQLLPAPGPGPVHALSALPDGALLAGGDGGRIFRSNDKGKSWRRVHGPAEVDVLFVQAPGEVSTWPAVVAHSAAGLEVAMVFAALPVLRRVPSAQPLRGELYLRSAAAAAGAGGALVLGDFPSIAADPSAREADEQELLRRWSARLDAPAEKEMLRQLVAAIRLYRPRVLARGYDGYEGRGRVAENRLVSRVAGQAVELAADAKAFPELLRLGLRPWKVQRVFTGFKHNEHFVPPWRKTPRPSRLNLAAEFAGWWYPKSAGTSLSMLALRAMSKLPWLGPLDRPAAVTAYRCSEVLPRQRLFTTGLSPKHLAMLATPPVGRSVATGAVLRAAGLLEGSPAAALGPLLKAVESHRTDPLPADMLYLLCVRLLECGRLAEAADAQRALLVRGQAHPLQQRISVAAVAMAASSEWRNRLARLPPAPRPGRGGAGPPPVPFKRILRRLLTDRWRAWVADEPGAMLMGKAYAFAGDFETARAAYKQLAAFTPQPEWRAAARVELAALRGSARAIALADAITVPMVKSAAVKLDGRTDEPFWRHARAVRLEPASPATPRRAAVTARLAALPAGLAVGIRLRPGRRPQVGPDAGPLQPDGAQPAEWKLDLALDADRDTWTQVVLTCDSTGRRRLKLLTRLAPPGRLKAALLPAQARSGDGGTWTVELLVPNDLLGRSPARAALLRLQVRVAITDAVGRQALYYLRRQADPRLLPHRYGLVALPGQPR